MSDLDRERSEDFQSRKSAKLRAESTETRARSAELTRQSAKLEAEATESRAQLEEIVQQARDLRQSRPSIAPIIHVVDDDEPFVMAICRLLGTRKYMVRSYGSVSDFLISEIPDAPGCILIDVFLPGPSGLDLQRILSTGPAPLPMIFMSGRADVPICVQAMKGGAMDFLTKPIGRETLLPAVQNAVARSIDDRSLLEQLRHTRACYERLTKCEAEVFERVVTGKINKEIADELGTAERTVKAHRGQVMRKMCVSSVAELVRAARQLEQTARTNTAG
jgi:FixJ family two-component response regulator